MDEMFKLCVFSCTYRSSPKATNLAKRFAKRLIFPLRQYVVQEFRNFFLNNCVQENFLIFAICKYNRKNGKTLGLVSGMYACTFIAKRDRAT